MRKKIIYFVFLILIVGCENYDKLENKEIENIFKPNEIEEIKDINGNSVAIINKQTKKPLTGIVEYDVRGKICIETSYRNGKIDGITKEYFGNGKVRRETSYRNGKENGDDKMYYSNGNIFSILKYKDGVRYGVTRNYYIDGSTLREISFKNGKIDGYERWYDKSGKLFTDTSYTLGKKDGIKKIYIKDAIAEIIYKDDKVIDAYYIFEDGVKGAMLKSEVKSFLDKVHNRETSFLSVYRDSALLQF